MLRRASSNSVDGGKRGQLSRVQVSPPFFWDFGVYERVFGKTDDAAALVQAPLPPKSTVMMGESAGSNTPSNSKRVAWSTSFKEEDLVVYVVQFGDTFDSIALKHDMTAVELRRANPGVPFFSQAIPGQEVKVKRFVGSWGLSKSTGGEQSSEEVNDAQMPSVQRKGSISEDQQHEGVECEAMLCVGSATRVRGRIVVGVSSGFLLFEPLEQSPQNLLQAMNVKMLFALDRNDILGCAAVSRITARLKPGDDDPSMLLQVVWKNADLGFAGEQQLFFELASADIGLLVDAIYSSDPLHRTSAKVISKTLTSGVAALRLLEEHQESALVEDFVSSSYTGVASLMEDEYPEVLMTPRESSLVTPEHVTALARMLPERLRGSRWRLIYDFNEHGVSLHALISAAKLQRETVLFVRDMDLREVIGVFATEAWDTGKTGFYGTGETFVFRIKDNEVRDIQKFTWSGTNEFFQTCSQTHLGVGGGGNFALCLDGDLLHCTSGTCLTFSGLEHNTLATNPSFRTDGIELWTFETFTKPRAATASSDDCSRSPVVSKSPRAVTAKKKNSGEVLAAEKKEEDAAVRSGQRYENNDDQEEYVKL